MGFFNSRIVAIDITFHFKFLFSLIISLLKELGLGTDRAIKYLDNVKHLAVWLRIVLFR